MADSDEDYIGELSEDGEENNVVQPRGGSARVSRSRRKRQRGGAEWEVSRTWETLVEGADGTISSTVEGLLEAGKRKRLLKDTTPLQRGIIRHLILILDLSQSMTEKDLRPTRYLLMIRYAQDFVKEFFEQNPIAQLGVLGLRDGLAIRITDMSGNPTEHISAIQALRDDDPKGLPSMQNGLEMARGALFHTPSHGTREILIVFGSLLSSDPGDIHQTIATLVNERIRVGIVGLAAQVAICRDLCSKTNGGDDTAYGVALNEQHFRELMMDVTTPPATYSQKQSASSLLMMGFPSRTVETLPSLCACHSKPSRGGYSCSRCDSKVCGLPAECPSCGLTLILSTHLARSYHHLFPLINWVEVPWQRASLSTACFACGMSFPPVPPKDQWQHTESHSKGMSVSSRYECNVCRNHFCIDCDVFAHEVVHNCPGCQSGVVSSEKPETSNTKKMSQDMDTSV
ncbi:TFIIH basal transcription factor complex, subunit SSL1 [Aspergillus campestris IBT 28561]|uniref:General transcription and DNA repair factor IIH n=1 Tax=Aspergillus campestris (strain IBT 28561) TaxID=1392248 RepID=A0A2I1D275_ASPC2|nr:TFIIH basal transcription factor complex, subunit SSL1 [Aspergillus campestris IBT 28561]PKY03976.1 TFIIH basal transcription factor complex, subunit SSL1 [Aspergillus campestris IBT 28561]